MNYPLRDAIIDFVLSGRTWLLRNTVCEQINNYPKEALDCLMNDSTRIITLLGRRKTITDKDLMGRALLDESEYQIGKCREKCASVLQFFLYGVPSVYYGDEEGLEGDLDPYNRRCFNWESPDKELLEHYKKIAKIRRGNKVFEKGETQIVYAKGGTFMFKRGKGKGQIYVAVNCSNHVKECFFNKNMKDLYSNTQGKKFDLQPLGFGIYKEEN